MKVILRADQIPIGSTVSKVNGEKTYVISDTVKIVGIHLKEIKAEKGSRLLFGGGLSTTLSSINGDTELVWHVSEEELYNYLSIEYEF